MFRMESGNSRVFALSRGGEGSWRPSGHGVERGDAMIDVEGALESTSMARMPAVIDSV